MVFPGAKWFKCHRFEYDFQLQIHLGSKYTQIKMIRSQHCSCNFVVRRLCSMLSGPVADFHPAAARVYCESTFSMELRRPDGSQNFFISTNTKSGMELDGKLENKLCKAANNAESIS